MGSALARRPAHTRRSALAGGAALALAGCGLPALPGWRGGPAAPRAELAELAEPQTLRLNAGDPETIDPARVSYLSEVGVVMRVFSNLLTFDARGDLTPDAAERLPAVSAGGKILTFTLRPNLRYSDGRPVTAGDFQYGWQRHLDPRTAAEYAFAGYAIEGAEALATATARDADTLGRLRAALGVRAKDQRTLEFRLVSPAPWFLSVLATWCGVPVREDVVEQGGDRWTEPPGYTGNGPYVLRFWERQNRMLFAANPYYHRGPPALQFVEIFMIGEPSVALAAYRNGEIDVAGVQREDLAAIRAETQLKRELQQFPGNCTTYLGFNVAKAPFDRREVRRAFSLAIDRDAYVADVLGGLAEPAGQLVPSRFPGHFADLRGQTHDPAAARKALADAGYPGGQGFPSVRFRFAAGARGQQRVEALIGQLRRTLGVEVLADPVDARALASLTRSPETIPQLFQLGWCQDYPDPQNWYSIPFHSRSAASSTGWSNPEYDRLVEQADAEGDARKRAGLYKAAAQVLLDDAPAAFLYHSAVSRLVKPWVIGLGQNPLEYFEGQANLANLKILKR
jgi:oligopeptide transport system substrate-binding protein